MSDYQMPGFNPKYLGRIVKIQIIPRSSKDSDTLLPDKMRVRVGILEGYERDFGRNRATVSLRGDGWLKDVDIDLRLWSIECWVQSEKIEKVEG